jgi:methionyl-tRNA formyltransferase
MRAGIIGNTRLTYKCISLLQNHQFDIDYVFGLPPSSLKNKVNAWDISEFCYRHNIAYINDNDWDSIVNRDVDIVFEMGDSRIVPVEFLQNNKVIGNHGAILPFVQGAASLVWGRMLNNGEWGVSLFMLDEEIDTGDILVTKTVRYNPESTSMYEFTELCDDATVECLSEYLEGNYQVKKNELWQAKLKKDMDSQCVVDILRHCYDKNINIYLPPRRRRHSALNDNWRQDFKASFMIANDVPYSRWFRE